jgi:putative ABC transport system permease protein
MKTLRRIAYWLRSRREDAALREELEFHRAEAQRHLEAGGVDPERALLESRRAMGNMTLAREESRDAWAVRLLDVLWRDVRGGARALRREPTFALTAILTLAIGVATTTTVFSVVDAELWKPLPFEHANELVVVTMAAGEHAPYDSISGADFLDWSAAAPAVAEMAGYGADARRTLRRDAAESVRVGSVTWNLFETVGRRAIAGRTFAPDDGRSGGVILTDRLWRRLFNGDPSIVGGSLLLDEEPVRVVGIVREVDVDGPEAEVFVPIDDANADFRDRGVQTLTTVIGRLRSGATPVEAQTQLRNAASRIARDFPDGRKGHVLRVEDFQQYYGRYTVQPLYFFLGASVFVLVLTCVNVAGLLLARALKRRAEFAIRGALGGGTGTLLRQLVVEGFCLALPASALALLLAHWAVAVFTTQVPPDYLWRRTALAIDWRVANVALAICVCTAAIFGLAPALAARRLDVSATLGNGARTAGGSRGQSRVRTSLLGTQIALTVLMLAGAGLFVKSYAALIHVPLGFDPNGGVSISVSLTGERYKTEQQLAGYAEALRQRALAIPGIDRVILASSSPMTSGPVVRFAVGNPAFAPADERRDAIIRSVSPGYFSVLGIPLRQGREFTSADSAESPRVAIVNEVLARRYFRGESPLGRALTLLPGQRVQWTRKPGEVTIIGVAANTKEVGLNEVEINGIYVPRAQMPSPWLELIARTSMPVSAVAAPLRAAAAAVDPRIPVRRVVPLDARVDDALREDRFYLVLMVGFAVIALLLASLGVYGAVAYATEQRRREFGVRLALGANGRSLVLDAIARTVRLAALGAAAGLALALVLAKVIGTALYLVPGVHDGLLFGVSTTDPTVLTSAVAVLIGVTLVASAIPARRVASIDPVTSLRQD